MKVYDGSQTGGTGAARDREKVGIAEYEVTTGDTTLTTSGLGSCIGVALYDPSAGVAGLVHVMLPSADEMENGSAAKFADSGTEQLIESMERHGARTNNLVAKIAGGSNMLDFSNGEAGIGERNAAAVRETLEATGVPIEGEDVGGDHGRSLRFEPSSGELVIRSADGENIRL